MQPIIIGSAEVGQEIAQRLASEFDPAQADAPLVEIRDSQRGTYRFFECRLVPPGEGCQEPPEREATFRDTLAGLMASVVIDSFEQRLIRRIIGQHYSYFATEEQEMLALRARRSVASDDARAGAEARRLPRIRAQLREYLQQANDFVLEGFVMFRLRDYIDELEDAVDQAVDDFLMEREYREFIRLLKHFVDVQEPRVGQVQVVLGAQGTFQLIDEQGRIIQDEYLDGFVADLVDADVNHEDLLISALITIAPSRVTLHGHQSKDVGQTVETIESVFSGRVDRCPGCHRCRAARAQGAVLSST